MLRYFIFTFMSVIIMLMPRWLLPDTELNRGNQAKPNNYSLEDEYYQISSENLSPKAMESTRNKHTPEMKRFAR